MYGIHNYFPLWVLLIIRICLCLPFVTSSLTTERRLHRDCVEHNNDGLHSNSCNDDVDMTSSSSSQHSNNSTSPSPKSISPSYSSCASNAESVNGDLSSSTISSHSHHHHNASAADRGEREKDKGESSSSSECCECGERVASASGPPLPGPLKGKKRTKYKLPTNSRIHVVFIVFLSFPWKHVVAVSIYSVGGIHHLDTYQQ